MKGLTPVVSVVLLVFLVLAVVGGLATFMTTTVEDAQRRAEQERAIDIKAVTTDCDGWMVEVAFRNAGAQNVSKDDLDVYMRGTPRYFFLQPDPVEPGDVARVEIPFFGAETEYLVELEHNFGHQRSFQWGCGTLAGTSKLALIARPNDNDAHWVVYDYVHENYSFYQSTDGDLTAEDGPTEGDVVVVENQDAYTIQTSSSSWDDRPVDTPIVLVRNPNPNEDWEFTWTDPHGDFTFVLPALKGVQDDYLIFWEDLYNPYNTRNMDDWKDHVVRVSRITPAFYRIAPYLGKGGYKHQFNLFVENNDPLQSDNIYNKSGGTRISNVQNGKYHAYDTYFSRN